MTERSKTNRKIYRMQRVEIRSFACKCQMKYISKLGALSEKKEGLFIMIKESIQQEDIKTRKFFVQ